MSFVDGFFTFSLNINNTNSGVYESVRIKTAKHPEESVEHLVARVLVYAHSFETGMEFSQGLYEPKEATIWTPDGIGGYSSWINVGPTDVKKLKRAVKDPNINRIQVHFYTDSQSSSFCHALRGSKQNWIEEVDFYQIEEKLIGELTQGLDFRNSWECTFVDTSAYVTSGHNEFNGSFFNLDIWNEFQASIGNSNILK